MYISASFFTIPEPIYVEGIASTVTEDNPSYPSSGYMVFSVSNG